MTFLKAVFGEKRNYFMFKRAIFVHLDETDFRDDGIEGRNDLLRPPKRQQFSALDIDVDDVVLGHPDAMGGHQRIERHGWDADRLRRVQSLDDFAETFHRQNTCRLGISRTAGVNMEIDRASPVAYRIIEQPDVFAVAEFRFKNRE